MAKRGNSLKSPGEVHCKLALFYMEKDRYAGPGGENPGERTKEREQALIKAGVQISLAEKEIKPDQKNDLMLLTYVKGRYQLEKDPTEAIKEFTRPKSMAEEAGVRKHAFLASVGLGLAHERLEKWEEAKTAFRQAVEYAETIRRPWTRNRSLPSWMVRRSSGSSISCRTKA